jgi:hypothetical protein
LKPQGTLPEHCGAAQVRWSQAELDQLQSLWVQAYKRTEYLANGTATDVFIFPKKWGGEELSTPINIIAQELCNNIWRSGTRSCGEVHRHSGTSTSQG